MLFKWVSNKAKWQWGGGLWAATCSMHLQPTAGAPPALSLTLTLTHTHAHTQEVKPPSCAARRPCLLGGPSSARLHQHPRRERGLPGPPPPGSHALQPGPGRRVGVHALAPAEFWVLGQRSSHGDRRASGWGAALCHQVCGLTPECPRTRVSRSRPPRAPRAARLPAGHLQVSPDDLAVPQLGSAHAQPFGSLPWATLFAVLLFRLFSPRLQSSSFFNLVLFFSSIPVKVTSSVSVLLRVTSEASLVCLTVSKAGAEAGSSVGPALSPTLPALLFQR